MKYNINQSIHINLIRIGVVANSSVIQIGSAGIIKPLSKIYSHDSVPNTAPTKKEDKLPFKTVEL